MSSFFSTTYRVAPVANSTTKHNEAALGHAKLTQGPRLKRAQQEQIVGSRWFLRTRNHLKARVRLPSKDRRNNRPRSLIMPLADGVFEASYLDTAPQRRGICSL